MVVNTPDDGNSYSCWSFNLKFFQRKFVHFRQQHISYLRPIRRARLPQFTTVDFFCSVINWFVNVASISVVLAVHGFAMCYPPKRGHCPIADVPHLARQPKYLWFSVFPNFRKVGKFASSINILKLKLFRLRGAFCAAPQILKCMLNFSSS